MRKCIECGAKKEPSEFGVNRNMPDGIHRRCRACVAARGAAYHAKNRAECLRKMRERRLPAKIERARLKAEFAASPEGIEAARLKAEAAKELKRASERARYAANPRRFLDKDKAVRESRPEATAAYKRAYREKLKQSPAYVVNTRMSARMLRAIRKLKAGRSWVACVGYSVDELMAHLERQFVKGMGWHNMGEWHIDHIVPVSKFNVTEVGDPEFIRAWSLTNLRPLWAKDNLRKGARLVSLL